MGGNVFFGSGPIRKEDIKPTLSRFIQDFLRVFPKAKGHFEGIRTLGSVGKKDVSGDIDLALDEKAFSNIKDWGLNQKDVDTYFAQFQKRARSASKQQLMKRAVICCISDRLEAESSRIKTDTKSAGNGTLFCQYPQFNSEGEMLDKEVQIDINIGNVDLLQFAYYSDAYPSSSNVKGLHRTQLMLAMFTNKGLTFTHNGGVKDKSTGKFLATTPKQIIELLNSLYGFNIDEKILRNFYSLYEYIEKNVGDRDRENIYKIYLGILDHTRCDIPDVFQELWLDKQDEWGLKGKFLPSSSKLFPFRED